MRRREVILALALFAAVLCVASLAIAQQVLTVTPSSSSITYRNPLKLTVTAAESLPTTITVQRRYPEGSWAVIRTIPASLAAETTTFVVPTMPSGTAGFRAVQGGVESAVATVTVRARLSRPVVATSIRAGRRVVIKGFIWPRHALGTEVVTLNMYWRASRSDPWPSTPTITATPSIVGRVAYGAKWSYRWTPAAGDRGLWKFVVTHSDAMHVPSTSGAKYLRVR